MSKLNIIVHPQAMLIISDHYSRLSYDNPDPPLKYHIGVLLGNYENDKVVVLSALEILITENDGRLSLDKGIYKREMDLHKTIYPNHKAIGWYTLDNSSHEELLSISDILDPVDDFDNLLFGQFTPNPEGHPFHLFIQKGTEFVPTDYTYESELAETIAMLTLQSEESAESQIRFTQDAFRTLDQDLSVIEQYLDKVSKKELPFDSTLVRECANIAQWFNFNGPNQSEEEDNELDETEEQSSMALLAGSMFETVTVILEMMRQRRK
ncbi:COP9 signalosome complex subunit 6 [Tritrichomonas musculus]|uniref:COP9 signalosome complex subunit 6 n=1 Tax=Tritrichomonas musculus TaxID=1915356 RepID=A0ABR2I7W0_9EUKA